MKDLRYILLIIYFSISIFVSLKGRRNIHRPRDPFMPEIITNWVNDDKTYRLKSYHFEEHALFKQFDYDYFMAHLLPKQKIQYRNNPNKSVSGEELSLLIDNLLLEIAQHKTKFRDFKVLKENDFNRRTISGYLIVKFRKYPFVLKLSMENPESFVQPYSKGWQPGCIFLIGGGITRYLSGFTRLKNLEAINKRIAEDKQWCKLLDTPRKWFWTPINGKWFQLHGKNIGNMQYRNILLPAIYGVVTDFIEEDKTINFKNYKGFGLKLAHFLGNRVDPHIDNFMVEKGTGKIVIIDTEHFATMVGLKRPLRFRSYSAWYTKLSLKYLNNRYCRNKQERRQLQINPTCTICPC